MNKKTWLAVLLSITLAACGTNATPEALNTTAPPQKVVPGTEYTDADLIWPEGASFSDEKGLIAPQQINWQAHCYTYTSWETNAGCTGTQRDLVNYAGYVYREVRNGGGAYNITIGATYKNGTVVVTVNGSANDTTKALVRQTAANSRWGYLAAAGYDHAETALAKAFGLSATGDKRDIGISNPAGPCDTCKGTLANTAYVTFYKDWMW